MYEFDLIALGGASVIFWIGVLAQKKENQYLGRAFLIWIGLIVYYFYYARERTFGEYLKPQQTIEQTYEEY